MSDVQDPLPESEQVSHESGQPPPDKKIVFGVRKPTEEMAAITALPLVIEAPFPYERTLQWLPESWGPEASQATDEPNATFPDEFDDEDHSANENVPGELRPTIEADGNAVVVVSQEVLLKVSEHVSQSLERELGGFLLGNRYRCPNTPCDYVIIDQYSPAKFTESTSVRLAFTHEAWAQLSDELSGKFLGKLLIGWYHSHPGLDVFLSSHDQEIHRERFSEPWMVALVLEPEKHRGGFFCERDGRVSPNFPVEFFELLERNSRDSVLAWENYNAVDPATSAAPVMSETNTASLQNRSSPEIQAARTAKGRKVPVKPRRRRRLLFTIGLLAILAGAIAAAVVNRTIVKTWVRNRIDGLSAAPSPSVVPEPSPQLTPESSPSPTPSQTPSPEPKDTGTIGTKAGRRAAASVRPAASPTGTGTHPAGSH